MSEERYIVFDEEGIVHESGNEEEALNEFHETKDFKGDLIIAKIIARRR